MQLIKINSLNREELKEAITEIALETCNVCNGTGAYEWERYHGIYETTKCEICNGTGQRLSAFMRNIIGGRK